MQQSAEQKGGMVKRRGTGGSKCALAGQTESASANEIPICWSELDLIFLFPIRVTPRFTI
jgi:hypothetical protein